MKMNMDWPSVKQDGAGTWPPANPNWFKQQELMASIGPFMGQMGMSGGGDAARSSLLHYDGTVIHNIQIRTENLFLISCEGEQPCGIPIVWQAGRAGCTALLAGITLDAPSHALQ